MRRRRDTKPLRRATARRPELRTVVVFCEGKNSEPDYIRGLKRLPEVVRDTALNLELHPRQGVPLTLVQMAADRLEDPEVDACWCVFDVEWPRNHPNLAEARQLAEARGIRLAISNPCFELWLVLHHQEFTKQVATAEAERLSRKLDGRSAKSIDSGFYLPLRKMAAARAAKLEERHAKDGTNFPHDNPSSGMHHLLRALEPGTQPAGPTAGGYA
ncbi:RloB domain-containing protein [Natronosporangium hydrolyticum]|uniref:RloB domain-containing protein n=1 Tax=Natronosporangium hydrolyticum TaxID=2811111 RepID=A0A895YKB6_9ACTN|nr:RloB family protein [Natronosporangium hydrolyticum]QSB15076.1 RloB domain-containing protein [Natronosporangium hydrolyticum]